MLKTHKMGRNEHEGAGRRNRESGYGTGDMTPGSLLVKTIHTEEILRGSLETLFVCEAGESSSKQSTAINRSVVMQTSITPGSLGSWCCDIVRRMV